MSEIYIYNRIFKYFCTHAAYAYGCFDYLSCSLYMFILYSLHLCFRVFTTVVKAKRVCSWGGGGGTGSLGTVQPPRDKLKREPMH